MYTLTLSTSVSMMSFPSFAFRKPCIPGVAFLYLNTVSLPGVFWLEKWVGKKIGCHSKGFSIHLPKAWYFWSVYFLFCFGFFNFQWCLFYNKEGLLIPSVGLIWEAQFIGLQGVWDLTDSSTRDLLVVWGLPHWFSFPAPNSIPQPVLPSTGWFPLTLKQPWVTDTHSLRQNLCFPPSNSVWHLLFLLSSTPRPLFRGKDSWVPLHPAREPHGSLCGHLRGSVFQRTEPLSSGAHTTQLLLVALVVICLSPSLDFFWSKASMWKQKLSEGPSSRAAFCRLSWLHQERWLLSSTGLETNIWTRRKMELSQDVLECVYLSVFCVFPDVSSDCMTTVTERVVCGSFYSIFWDIRAGLIKEVSLNKNVCSVHIYQNYFVIFFQEIEVSFMSPMRGHHVGVTGMCRVFCGYV